MKKFNIVEFFSGIGSQARALENIGIKKNVQATCEWDLHAFIAYDAIHEGTEVLPEVELLSKDDLIEKLSKFVLSNDGKTPMAFKTLCSYDTNVLKRAYSSILRTKNLVDVSSIKGEEMPNNTDILTYSFPCQDLSNVGAFHGYNKGIDKQSGSRSSLLWQVGRILQEMKQVGKTLPRYLVMENVPTLLSTRHIDNFETWINELKDLGYISKYVRVNAKNYGIPQNRPRLLMLSVFAGDDLEKEEKIKKYFETLTEEKVIDDYKKSKYYKNLEVKDLLRITTDKNSKLWEEALDCTPNDTPSRRKIWEENPQIINSKGEIYDEKFIRTLTTKQDRHPNSGNIYFDSGVEKRGKFRYLTPRECLLFMGFEDRDYDNLQLNNPVHRGRSKLFPRDKIIRMAGNSIPVKMLEGFFYQFYEIEKLMNDKK